MSKTKKPTIKELTLALPDALDAAGLVLPFRAYSKSLDTASRRPGDEEVLALEAEERDALNGLENAYVVYKAAQYIYGNKETARDIECLADTESQMQITIGSLGRLYDRYFGLDSNPDREKRFESLNKIAYFFAKSVYPETPAWKPGFERIATLLDTAIMEGAIKLLPAYMLDGKSADMVQAEVLAHKEREYLYATVVGLIHGKDDKWAFGGSDGSHKYMPAKYVQMQKDAMGMIYSAQTVTGGATAFVQRVRALDALAQKFTKSIYADFAAKRTI